MESKKLPSHVDELFENKESIYEHKKKILSSETNKVEDLLFFIESLNISESFIEKHEDQVLILKHPSFNYKLLVISDVTDDKRHLFEIKVIE